jgi:hypothetical protein
MNAPDALHCLFAAAVVLAGGYVAYLLLRLFL